MVRQWSIHISSLFFPVLPALPFRPGPQDHRAEGDGPEDTARGGAAGGSKRQRKQRTGDLTQN